MSQSKRASRESTGATNSLAEAHARFARATLLIFLGAAAVAVSLLIAALVTDRAHEEDQIRERLLLETDVRAHSLGQHLGLLVEELQRLGLRSEVNLLDQDLAPEKSLLQLSHEKSTFFNLGVGIIGPKGEVLWTEPKDFIRDGRSFADEKWFTQMRRSRELRIVPVQPHRPDSVLYVVSPLIRNGEFAGALLGGVDLARGEPLAEGRPALSSDVLTVLATQEGEVVYPPSPPSFADDPAWRAIFKKPSFEPFNESVMLGGVSSIVAASPVSDTDLVLMSIADSHELFSSARSRLTTRLGLALVMAISPVLVFIVLLRRSLKVFRRSEEDAVREERLRHLGEAANSIAHEVKNALNGLSMGLDLVVRRDGRPQEAERRERVLGELRKEIQRLSEFTTELMTFSKGIEPRRARINLTEFVPKMTGLFRDSAGELGAEIDLIVPEQKVMVDADPTLLHAVISNLAGNALDAVTSMGSPTEPRIAVRLEPRGEYAELRVGDNGPGVSPTMMPHLFELFQTDKESGVGIGLALAKKIARAHGGDLVLESNRGAAPPSPLPPPSNGKPTATPLPSSGAGSGISPLPSAVAPLPGATFLLTLPLSLEDA